MAICASGEKLLQEATGIRRGRVYPVAKYHMSKFKKIFCYLQMWPGRPLTTMQYVMYLRFCGWRHVL